MADRFPTFAPPFAALAERMNLTFVDIGARGGLDEALLPLAEGVTAVGFEPEPDEAARLRAAGDRRWRKVRILPFAVGGTSGGARLHVSPTAVGASLIPHNPAMLDRFGHDNLHGPGTVVDVTTVTLDQLVEDGELRRVDYLKIDIEGAELSVLQAGTRVLKTCQAVKVECSFLEQRVAQPLVNDVIGFMLGQGFDLVDVADIHRWRRRPMPAHPYVAAFAMPYSRGQVAQCDLILLRRSNTLRDSGEQTALALVAASLGYFDFAIAVIRDHPDVDRWIAKECGVGLEHELRRLSAAAGKRAAWQEIGRSLRNLVPLARSVLGGLPVTPPRRPY